MDIECIAITYFRRQPNDTTAINIHDNEHDSLMFIYHERCIFERFFLFTCSRGPIETHRCCRDHIFLLDGAAGRWHSPTYLIIHVKTSNLSATHAKEGGEAGAA